MKKTNQSSFLIRMLEKFSNFLAQRRGLPIILGVLMVLIGGIFELAGVLTDQPGLDGLGIIIRTLGLVIAFVGILLLEPLGT